METEVNKKLPVIKGKLRLNLSDAFDIVSTIKVHANGILKKIEKYYIFCGMSLFVSGYYKPDEDIKWEFNTAKLRDVFVIFNVNNTINTINITYKGITVLEDHRNFLLKNEIDNIVRY